VGAHFTFWWKALRLGAGRLNSAAAWVGTAVLILGIAGIIVPLVFHLSPLVIAVVLISLLALIVAEGSYRMWHDTDEERKTAVAERNAARGHGVDRRRAQAKLVQVLKTTGRKPGAYFENNVPEGVSISVKNGSEQPIRDLIFCWRKGIDPWDDPDRRGYLLPGKTESLFREFPGSLSSGDDKKLFGAVVYFRDVDQVCWCATPDGDLMEGSPDQAGGRLLG
jgi:hypothetical protein